MPVARTRLLTALALVAGLGLTGCSSTALASIPLAARSAAATPTASPTPTASDLPQVAEADAAASPAPAGTAVVVTIGDSIMAGYGLSPDEAWPALLASQEGVSVTNLGCSGAGFVAIGGCGTNFGGLIGQAARADPSLVIIQSSDNDSGESDQSIQTATAQTVGALHEAMPDAVIVGFGTLWDEPSTAPGTIAASTAALQSALADVGGTFIDIGQPLISQPGLLQADGEHPTAAGQRVLVQTISQALADAGIGL